jgi:hypothetical protein
VAASRTLTDDDRRLVEVVVADLAYLRDEWGPAPSDDALRRSSAALRVLLVEDAFGRAWRVVGLRKQPVIHCPDLVAAMVHVPRADIAYAQAGGGSLPAGKMYGDVLFRGNHTVPATPPERSIGLSKFVDAPGILVNPALVAQSVADMSRISGRSLAPPSPDLADELLVASRRDVIKYVAHRLGGTHVGRARNEEEAKLWAALDMASKHFHLLEKPAVFYELLSIGRLTAAGSDAGSFMDTAHHVLEAG